MREELERRNIVFVQEMSLRSGFIADFSIPEKKLIVEVDGLRWHKPNNRKDRFRDYVLKRAGWNVIRFTEKEVYDDVKVCVDKIENLLT